MTIMKMKKVLLAMWLVLWISTSNVFAQRPMVGAFYDAQLGINYMNVNTEGNNDNSGYNVGFYGGYKVSLLGYIFSGLWEDSPFFIGDCIGVGSGFGYAKYQDPTKAKVFVMLNVSYGLQTAIHLTDDIDVGAHYLLANATSHFFGDINNTNLVTNGFGASARYKRIVGDITLGGKLHSNPINKDNSFITNIRYMLNNNETPLYIGFKLDSWTQKTTFLTNANASTPLDIKDKYINTLFTFGFMY
jgi:hypothetical protein